MPINPDFIKSKIDLVRAEIGRTVTFVTHVTNDDFIASGFYDPITDTSYKTIAKEETEVQARVHWAGDERITATPGGKYFIGDCTLTIDPIYHKLAQKAMRDSGMVIVDGKELQIMSIDPEGVPTVNRIRVVCKSVGKEPE
jgi:hypothetical protein